nr:PREDICTED: uncharacterized protein LOC107398640 [Tribolium castaneum]|eukprot:XP_015838949.1 PREDICTED: uncharacterized protein LOC107398640 [Tribolium castaneum]
MAGYRKYSCKYPGCTSGYVPNKGHANKHFFTFPKNPKLHELWRNACKIEDPVSSKFWRLCEDHFESRDFVNERKDKLNPHVVPKPCVMAPQEEFVEVSQTNLSVTEDNFVENSINHPSCICNLPSTSNARCFAHGLPLFTNSEVIIGNNTVQQDHNYCQGNNAITGRCKKFAFLNEGDKNGILNKMRLSRADLTSREKQMYHIHRNVTSRLSKLQKLLQQERSKVNTLQDLYNSGKFEFIDENLNSVTKEFINSQLRNATKPPSGRRWSEQDKAFALSVYKRSPRLYKYLQTYFQLPSSRTLKAILSKIPFGPGINEAILGHLQGEVIKMKSQNRFCTLIIDEISLSHGFHYEAHQQLISGFEDLGSLGRTNKAANHALVFMVRGIRKQWKQVVAYYFTAHTVSADNLKVLIKEIIGRLQEIGLEVVATVCDQGPTNQKALSQLCARFKEIYKSQFDFGPAYCMTHDCDNLILNRCTTFLIYKYTRDKQKAKSVTTGHIEKMKKFRRL